MEEEGTAYLVLWMGGLNLEIFKVTIGYAHEAKVIIKILVYEYKECVQRDNVFFFHAKADAERKKSCFMWYGQLDRFYAK